MTNRIFVVLLLLFSLLGFLTCNDQFPTQCEGYVKFPEDLSSEIKIDFSEIRVELYNPNGILKEITECDENGYYVIPLYDSFGEYILSINAPERWSFTPQQVKIQTIKGINTCLADVNFIFSGIEVFGKVSGSGSNCVNGPEGLFVNLVKESQEKENNIAQSITNKEGGFQFSNVLPGKYSVILDDHSLPNSWTISRGTIEVEIGLYENTLPTNLEISTYSIEGKVATTSEETLVDVPFLLYAPEGEEHETSESAKELLKKKPNLTNFKEYILIDTTLSNDEGFFEFSSVSCGEYFVTPFSESLSIFPKEKSVKITSGKGKLDTFLVVGFSAEGLVLDHQEKPVANAVLIFDEKVNTITNEDGQYTIENITEGIHDIKIEAEHYYFNEEELLQIELTPESKIIRTVHSIGYDICGKLNFENDQETESLSANRKLLIYTHDPNDETNKDKTIKIFTDSKGEYCFKAIPNIGYHIVPKISKSEQEQGLALHTAQSFPLYVNNGPLFEINFDQTIVNIEGRVICGEQDPKKAINEQQFGCSPQDMKSIVIRLEKSGKWINPDEKGEFTFETFPGEETIRIHSKYWCFANDRFKLQIKDNDVQVLFAQTGLLIPVQSSHSVQSQLYYAGATKKKDQKLALEKELNLESGMNLICVKNSGNYMIKTDNCYQYEQDGYRFNTEKKLKSLVESDLTKLELKKIAKSFKPKVFLKAQKIKIIGKIQIDNALENIPKEIQITVVPIVKNKFGTLTKKNKESIEISALKEENGPDGETSEFNFEFFGEFGKAYEFIPNSDSMLFYPKKIKTQFINEIYDDENSMIQASEQKEIDYTCPITLQKMKAKKGIFIVGEIKPSLSKVKIFVTRKLKSDLSKDQLKDLDMGEDHYQQQQEGKVDAEDEDQITAITNKKGIYKVGPLDDLYDYTVTAEKENYRFHKDKNNEFNFGYKKLGSITVKVFERVIDEKTNKEKKIPIVGVLLSLSGAGGFRSNQIISKKSGTFAFNDLLPGNFFLRTMLKEYEFETATTKIELTEGADFAIEILGIRTSYSCFGRVQTLINQPLKDLIVEATSYGEINNADDAADADADENKIISHEEAQTDSTGRFRIRGLIPSYKYTIRVKDHESFQRTSPNEITLEMSKKDIFNTNFVAFQDSKTFDLNGFVNTDDEFVDSLDVQLFRNNDNKVFKTIRPLKNSGFFIFSDLEQGEYKIKLVSNLDSNQYKYKLPNTKITIQKDTFKSARDLVQLDFSPKLIPPMSLSSSKKSPLVSLITFAFFIFCVYAGINYQKSKEILNKFLASIKKRKLRGKKKNVKKRK
ncbi:nodal modulator 1-related [Anaeramoeba flamelloides]|uniref:Nodal modulator 1-related n=1 Tax=Anaeramoeba flamelloides TaxID=1746091 RepID=A0AAV7ZDL2_9EUKA|nr:nodal modulator 1-related [Anaeramoeba flamelloides]